MGIQDIWPLIKPTATASNLADYALEYGYTKKLQGSDDMIFRIGIDVPALFNSFRHINSSTVLLQLFQFLCQLCHVPVADFVFMYNPVLGVDLEADSSEYEQSKQLVQSFNYHIDIAKRVVNAELSAMNKLGVIDAVLTNDSHIFPFGVKCVLSVNSTESTPTNLAIDIYCAKIIEQQLGIQEDGFILLALLLGSDFNEGVHGVDMKTAIALARHGFGKTLLHNYQQFSQVPDLLKNFFIQLGHEIADEIELNTSKNLHRQSPRHEFLDADFPSVDALEGLKIFTELVTHPSPPTPSYPLTPKWPYNVPHISNIAAFCTTHLCWSPEFMYQEFHSKLYRGVIIRMLCSKHVAYNVLNGELLVPVLQSSFNFDRFGRPFAFTLSTTIIGANPPALRGKKGCDSIHVEFNTSFFDVVTGTVIPNHVPQTIGVTIPIFILAKATRQIVDS
ncbi:hypothetical protein EV368DRAFT_83924 [Lentinula lateritia]|uniref:Uncharacterized protein n=1 Tax=Lentinula aff. lateritia TaxID=2804960 RepID=A0ACC1TJ92_9AGAR|nr:hypothetical protein F5876DRAFT_82583 [Lentinula aff. lateritia]KAJ3851058.1 hypothetical protein EV368DRAFT_83924 [Lentinula lateritia]